MKKILLILKLPPPYGGGEIMHQYLYDNFKSKSSFDFIISSSPTRTKGNQGKFMLSKIGEFIRIYFLFLFKIFSFRPNIVLFSLGKSISTILRDGLFVIPLSLLNIKIVAELHGIGIPYVNKTKSFQSRIIRFIVKRITIIRVLGKSIEDELNKWGIKNTIVIPNGIKIPNNMTLKKITSEVKTRKLLFVGTFSEKKGFFDLLNALALLKETNANFELHCMGVWSNNAFQQKAMNFIHSSQIYKYIVFHGLQTGDAKWSVYKACDILVLPSYEEGQPLVILEALGFGLMVIATNVGAIPDTIDNQNNLLFEPGNTEKLSKEIKFTLELSNEQLAAISKNNQRIFQNRYNLDNLIVKYDKIFNQ